MLQIHVIPSFVEFGGHWIHDVPNKKAVESQLH
jgi:hypothetical protein